MGQAASYGLTQYDVDELIAYTNGACESSFAQRFLRFLQETGTATRLRGNLGMNLIRSLQSPKQKSGFITSEEFLSIPELSINPLSKRLAFFFESINFKEFLGLLTAFSSKASRDEKLRFMFNVFDVDGDGAINEEDLTLILRQLAGSGLSDSEVANLVRRVFAATGASTDRGITFAEYRNALSGTHIELQVDVPAED
ncbi:hypothetical protein N2152v2_007609 [Parachlorella kessleri]